MDNKQLISQYCQQFKMGGIMPQIDQLIQEAQSKETGYMEYTAGLFGTEAKHRQQNDIRKRLKTAKLPRTCDLGTYDYSFDNGLKKVRLNQLRELNWLDQVYNIILMGPSGTGKTFLAAGLCADAIAKGYNAYFRTMEDLMGVLKMKDFTNSAKADYKRLVRANLIVIDDIMLFPVEKINAVALFNFINNIYEKTAFIVTTNKKPTEWAAMLNDEVLATALLDRLLYQCEVINLTGKSFRMKNRKTIFESNEK
jgi:DNA replication protein DnaC